MRAIHIAADLGISRPTVTYHLRRMRYEDPGVYEGRRPIVATPVCESASYLPLGFAADWVLGARPRVAQITTKVAGAAMILVGLALLVERAIEVAGH